jgi:phthalate 4,5-cis-dihydrodiol dehydrogenase
MSEFHGAISRRSAVLHDGAWGVANLEVCEAAIASSASGRDVELKHQVPLNTSNRR